MNHATYDGVTTPDLENIALQKIDATSAAVVNLEAVLGWCERLARRTGGHFQCGWPSAASPISRWWATLSVANPGAGYEDKGAYYASEEGLFRAALVAFIAASEYDARRAEATSSSRPA